MAFKNVASYSHSKSKMMGACALQYWRYTYGSWNGWWNRSSPPKNADAGEMYAAKHVDSVASWRGTLVHVAAERALKAAMEGRRFADAASVENFMLLRTKKMFDRQWEQATTQKTGSSKHRLILRELEQEDLVDPNEIWKFVSGRISALCSDDSAWSGLSKPINMFIRAVMQPKRIVLVEDLVSFKHADLVVWLSTDLIMRSPKDDRRCVIVDWKTGKKRQYDRNQAELYGAWCLEKGWTSAEVLIVYVGESTVEVDHFEVTPEMTASALSRVELFAEDLRDRLVGGNINRNEPIFEKFEATDRPSVCHNCSFIDVCEREGTKP